MRSSIIPTIVLASVLGGCTSMYKAGQTPDDVYFSPAREATGYVRMEDNRDDYYDDGTDLNDRYLRMKAINRRRWSRFDDDFMYWNNPVWNNAAYFNSFNSFSAFNPFYSSFMNPWVNTWGWGTGFHPGLGMGVGLNTWNTGFFNPFMPGFYGNPVVIVSKPVNPRVYTPRGGNLGTYQINRATFESGTGGRTYNIGTSPKANRSSGGNYYSSPSYRSGRYNSNSSESNFGTPSRNFSNGSSNSAPRSSGGGSSPGGTSGGSAPVRTFPRGGGR